ncbi:MAG TPA: TetR/AcrR family transcriptional regulator [Bacillales bacterium]|nr:TetR/AcrR family transcriptional regulator [Bacillales bacterium]
MTDKKEEIMHAAIHLFSERGYFSTSVQEIASSCGISKGSLYNFFDSKEDLLIQVIEHNHRKMLQRAVNVNLDSSQSERERLIKKVVVQMEDFRANKDFMVMLFRALPPHDNPKIPMLMKKIRVSMTNWHKKCLEEAFGSQVEPYIWDFVLMFQGALKEYLSLTVHEQKDIDLEKAARFIVARFDTMIRHTEESEPALSPKMMKEYEELEMGLEPQSPEEQLDHLFSEIKGFITNLTVSERDRQELHSAVQSLYEEIHGKEPQAFLIKALFLFLTEKEELKDPVHRLEATLETIGIDRK